MQPLPICVFPDRLKSNDVTDKMAIVVRPRSQGLRGTVASFGNQLI